LNHREALNALKDYAKVSEKMVSVFIIGSYARGTPNSQSDLDAIIVSEADPELIFHQIKQRLGEQISYELRESSKKHIFFLGEEYLKLDLTIVRDPSETETYYKTSKITDTGRSIIVDKTSTLEATLQKWNNEPKTATVQLINDEIDKFLVSYDATQSAIGSGDAFQAYFQYNLSLTRLIRLIQLERGDSSYLYAPKNFLESLPPDRSKRVSKLSASLDLNELRQSSISLASEFEVTISNLSRRFNVSRTLTDVRLFIQKTNEKNEPQNQETPKPDANRVSSLLTSYWRGAVIQAAVRTRIFDYLRQYPKKTEEISEDTRTNSAILTQVLDSLKRMNLVDYSMEGWRLTSDGELLKESADPSLSSSAEMWWAEHLDAWRHLDHTLLTGEPVFEDIFGKTYFDWLEDNPGALKQYQSAMEEYAKIDYSGFASIIDKYSCRNVIDIGGGTGTLIEHLLRLNRETRATLFEKPQVIDLAEELWRKKPDRRRITFMKGDFFTGIQGTYEGVILTRILHDWSDDKVNKILTNIKKALKQEGTIFVIDRVLREDTETSLLNLDLALMTGGKERTLTQWNMIFNDNKLRIDDHVDLINGLSLLLVKIY
jgi:predicted nucleotidyltransferase/SAM-dependent methyltransferase